MQAIDTGIKNAISSYRDYTLYEDALLWEIDMKYLHESYHISYSFDKCIYDIIKKVNNGQYDIDIEIYSGWHFDSLTKSCTIDNIGFPIYIKIVDDKISYNDMSVIDRDSLDDGKIHVIINLNRLSNCNANKRAVIAHEFRHALEMFIDPKKSHICDKQINYQDLTDLHINDKLINNAMYIAILFSLSEERARIDSVIHYLKDIDNKIDYDDLRINKKEIISKYIEDTKDLHLLYNMILYIDELSDYLNYGLYQRILLIGYFLDKIGNTKFKITKEFLQNVNDSEAEYKCEEIFKYLEKNQKDFMLHLSDCIATHIVIK